MLGPPGEDPGACLVRGPAACSPRSPRMRPRMKGACASSFPARRASGIAGSWKPRPGADGQQAGGHGGGAGKAPQRRRHKAAGTHTQSTQHGQQQQRAHPGVFPAVGPEPATPEPHTQPLLPCTPSSQQPRMVLPTGPPALRAWLCSCELCVPGQVT